MDAKTLESELAKATATIAELTGKISAHDVALATANEQITGLTGELAKEKAKAIELDGKVSALTSENVALKAKEQDIEVRASIKAKDIAAGQGIPPVNVDRSSESAAAKTTDEHFAVYAAITDPTERGKYYEKHLASAFSK